MYRISTAKEWEELQKNGSTFGGQLDKSSGFIHLSKLDQVNFCAFVIFPVQFFFVVIGIGCKLTLQFQLIHCFTELR